MDAHLREDLLAIQQHDLTVRERLAAAGALYHGYHPEMEAVHRANAARLRTLIDRHGWPSASVAGGDGASAAWLIVQHAIGEPAFMRHCLALLDIEVRAGRVPAWQHAYLHDRIAVSEGRPQRFGTQFDLTPGGPVVCDVEAPESLDERRAALGLEPLAVQLDAMAGEPLPDAETYARQKAEELAWRRAVGWMV